MGGVELYGHAFTKPPLNRKHILSVSTYQALLLMQFNGAEKDTYSFKELSAGLGIQDAECRRQLLSLTVSKHRVLNKTPAGKQVDDNDVFEVNTAFAPEKVKVVIGIIKKEEKVTEAPAPPIERKHVVDAAIVRIMKARKTLDHNTLLEEVFRQCNLFRPQPAQIKTQIEHLIDREFLKRDDVQRNVYIYVP